MSQAQAAPENKDHFLTAVQRAAGMAAPAWLKGLREQGAAKFGELPLPHRRLEEWRFTNVNPILRTTFQSALEAKPHGLTRDDIKPYLFGGSEWTALVFVNGFFDPDLSILHDRQGVYAGSLMHAAVTREKDIQPYLNQILNGSSNVFSALNTAFLLDGAFVHVGKNTQAPTPIHLVYITTEQSGPMAHHPRNLVVADVNSEAVLVESYVSLAGDGVYLNNIATEMELHDGAKVQRYKVLHEGAHGYHLASMKVRQQRDSQFKSFSIYLGGRIARNELAVTLAGEGADTLLNGLYLARDEELIDNFTHIEHQKPHCTSFIGYKGVLDDKSHSVFTGKVYVHRAAQKTDSNQLNQNLLLSDKATVDTKPQLEIYADDVKCTHGATIGQHETEQIYYFRTRGIAEDMARAMLTYGFADEVVRELEVDALRGYLEKLVFDRYSPIEA